MKRLAAALVSNLSALPWILGLAGCGAPGPIQVEDVPAPRRSGVPPLVIMLPGRGDTLWVMKHSGIAEAIQMGWPEADVRLAGVTMPYYVEGRVAKRIRDELIEPARKEGRREIYLAGASMGGAGALAYEHDYPGDVTGLVLFAPFLGSPKWIESMAAAGGPKKWEPPARAAATIDPDNVNVELWRVVKTWQDAAKARRVWLGCGVKDRFYPAAEMVAPLLPADHVVTLEGGHGWATWTEAARPLFSRIKETK